MWPETEPNCAAVTTAGQQRSVVAHAVCPPEAV